MKNELLTSASRTSDITVNANLNFTLSDWSASAVLITLCLSGVVVYGIKAWKEEKTIVP